MLRVADEENMEVSVFLGQFQGIDDRLDRILASSMFSGVKANLYSGYRAFKPFVDVINTILGVVAVALVVLLIASTLVDLIFLSCPEKIMNFRDSSGVIQYRGRHSKEVPVPPFISTEAIEAFYRSQIVLSQTSRGVAYNANINSTKSSRIEGHSVVDENIYLSYFLMRAPSYILLAICIAFLISGGLSGLIGFVLRLTSGFSF